VVPSIKGSIFAVVVEELRQHLDAGRIPRAAAELALTPDDLALIEKKLLAGSWYPIDAHERVLSLLCKTVGEGRREYLVEGGRRAADALSESGLYAQLAVEGDESNLKKFGRILVTLSGAIYSFSAWRFADWDHAHGRFTIEITDAAALPDVVVARAEGFVERAMVNAIGGQWQVTSQRPSFDRVLIEGRRADR
jgi:hypothetical protein